MAVLVMLRGCGGAGGDLNGDSDRDGGADADAAGMWW